VLDLHITVHFGWISMSQVRNTSRHTGETLETPDYPAGVIHDNHASYPSHTPCGGIFMDKTALLPFELCFILND
jgi:hypothetical protein